MCITRFVIFKKVVVPIILLFLKVYKFDVYIRMPNEFDRFASCLSNNLYFKYIIWITNTFNVTNLSPLTLIFCFSRNIVSSVFDFAFDFISAIWTIKTDEHRV